MPQGLIVEHYVNPISKSLVSVRPILTTGKLPK